MGTMIVDTFSVGIDDLPAKKQGSTVEVLRVLEKHKRFSVFEATANDRIAKTMDRIFSAKLVRSTGGAFPWTNIELTDKGRAVIEADNQAAASPNQSSSPDGEGEGKC